MKKLPVTLVLDRLRSAHNTGNIFRIAEAVGADGIIGCGYTPLPGHPKLAKTAMGSENMIETRHAENSKEAVSLLRSEGKVKQIVAVEPLPESVCAWDFKWEFPCAVILGNEALGIDPEALELCDAVVGLPMLGEKASVNVGNCAAVVLYAALRSHLQEEAS